MPCDWTNFQNLSCLKGFDNNTIKQGTEPAERTFSGVGPKSVITVGAPTYLHTCFFCPVLRLTSQLSFLHLITNPCTNPDNNCLNVTAYSILRFTSQQDSSTITIHTPKLVWYHFSALPQSNSLPLQSLHRDSKPTSVSHHSTLSFPPSLSTSTNKENDQAKPSQAKPKC